MSRYLLPDPGDHDPIAGPHDVSLRPIAERDLDALLRWLHDPAVVQFWGDPPADRDEVRGDYLEPDLAPTWRFIIEHAARDVGLI